MPRPSLAYLRAKQVATRPPTRRYYLHEQAIAGIDQSLAILDEKEQQNPLDHRIAPERERLTRHRRMLAGEAWNQEWWHAIGRHQARADREALAHRMDQISSRPLDAARIADIQRRLHIDP